MQDPRVVEASKKVRMLGTQNGGQHQGKGHELQVGCPNNIITDKTPLLQAVCLFIIRSIPGSSRGPTLSKLMISGGWESFSLVA